MRSYVLHLGGGGAQDVDQRHRLVPAAAGLLAGEDQEVLAVAAHTGGQVVQPEEVLQLVRVGLVVLQVGDQGQLAARSGDWLRRERLVKIALTLPRSRACSAASRTASRWTWSKARATSPISSWCRSGWA